MVICNDDAYTRPCGAQEVSEFLLDEDICIAWTEVNRKSGQSLAVYVYDERNELVFDYKESEPDVTREARKCRVLPVGQLPGPGQYRTEFVIAGRPDKQVSWSIVPPTHYGEELSHLQGHTGSVLSVAFSPDGQMLASGSLDDTIILWDVATGRPIGQPLTGHTYRVLSVAFSPDGQMLASGSLDGTIILWDVATGRPIGQFLTGHTYRVLSVAFSPDGQTLASGSLNGVILWNIDLKSR